MDFFSYDLRINVLERKPWRTNNKAHTKNIVVPKLFLGKKNKWQRTYCGWPEMKKKNTPQKSRKNKEVQMGVFC